MRKQRGFTLIELLIVVAIIAILAAIAVPNFLEAQVRSKIARGRADIRSIVVALEAYFVDWNGYPGGRTGDNLLRGSPELTTPVAYITSLPTDPFGPALRWGDNTGASAGQIMTTRVQGYKYFFLDYYGATDNSTWAERASLPINQRRMGYVVSSFGPDFADSGMGWFAVGSRNVNALYDPTNGTVSNGDFGRVGGDIRSDVVAVINR